MKVNLIRCDHPHHHYRRQKRKQELWDPLLNFALAKLWLLSPSLCCPPSPSEFCVRGWGVGVLLKLYQRALVLPPLSLPKGDNDLKGKWHRALIFAELLKASGNPAFSRLSLFRIIQGRWCQGTTQKVAYFCCLFSESSREAVLDQRSRCPVKDHVWASWCW